MQVLQAEQHTGGVEDGPWLAENLIVDVHHQVAAAGVLHHKADVLRRLKAGKKVDQEGVAHLGGRLEDALLRQQALHLVPSNNVALFERLDGKVVFCLLVLAEEDLVRKEEKGSLDNVENKQKCRLTFPKWPRPRTAISSKSLMLMPCFRFGGAGGAT